MDKKRLLKYLLMGVSVGVIVTFLLPKHRHEPTGQPRDYAEIAASGVLRAGTEYNSFSYHAEGDSVSGFHYQVVKAFARDHGLQLEMIPEMGFKERLQDLADGRFDLIAYGIPTTSELKDSLLLTTPIMLNRQVLVQRKAASDDDSLFIRSQLDLGGKRLHVVKGSPSILRIHNLASEIADTIHIEEVERYGSEQLISLVAHGDIDYVVCSEALARAAADSLPQLDTSTAISFTQFYSWGVSKQSPVLLDSLNTWLARYQQTKEYRDLYRRYYGDTLPAGKKK